MNTLTQSLVTGFAGGAVVLAGFVFMGQSGPINPALPNSTDERMGYDLRFANAYPVIVSPCGDQWLCVSSDGETRIVTKDGVAKIVKREAVEGLVLDYNPRFPLRVEMEYVHMMSLPATKK